jgi:hypothetical protein
MYKDKNSFEYQLWRKSTVWKAMLFLVVFPACGFLVSLLDRNYPPFIIPGALLVFGIVLLPPAILLDYIGSDRLYRRRQSGWTPLEFIKREDFVISLIRRLIERLKRK